MSKLMYQGFEKEGLTFVCVNEASKSEAIDLLSKALTALAQGRKPQIKDKATILKEAKALLELVPWAQVPDPVVSAMPQDLQTRVRNAKEAFDKAGINPEEVEGYVERVENATGPEAIAIALMEWLKAQPPITPPETTEGNATEGNVIDETLVTVGKDHDVHYVPFKGSNPTKKDILNVAQKYGPKAEVLIKWGTGHKWMRAIEVGTDWTNVLEAIAEANGWEAIKKAHPAFARAMARKHGKSRVMVIRVPKPTETEN